ncbi:MAG: nitroreductase family deazaflavin-dependent oxidoreductase [Oscillochloris sp.]|nr:nitroreductase family deazaflavin-dependent oxidoreductase [Oscillochloris sp.]
MEAAVWQAIERGLTCDITTIGRMSGQPRRIEIWYFVIAGDVYISGTPGARDWLANLRVHPGFTFHVKHGARADLPAHAEIIDEPGDRRRIMAQLMQANSYFAGGDLEAWVAGSPLVRVHFER